ncbi:MAG TPA: glycoside hydrolase family 95 protein [Sedimentisphaerales bacterium]|nr:glycoside hydrolase family 95 protein [Sedimentisphaerales bacterium]
MDISDVKRLSQVVLVTMAGLAPSISFAVEKFDPSSTVWYDKPAEQFNLGLPLGNGRLGMMVYGGTVRERIVLNEESLWSGSPVEHDRPGAHKYLAPIRELLLAGKNIEAEELVNQHFVGTGTGTSGRAGHEPYGCFQTLGSLWIEYDLPATKTTDYRRVLDMSAGIAEVRYVADGRTIVREGFVSAPDEVGVLLLKADRPGGLTCTVGLDRHERYESKAVGPSELLMTGQVTDGKQGDEGVRYAARIRVSTTTGQVKTDGDRLRITGADQAVILFDGETDYPGPVPRDRNVKDPVGKTAEILDRAAARPYEELKARHLADHRNYFNRISISLRDDNQESQRQAMLPTDRRISDFSRKGAIDATLPALYFNFGRYLLIGSSRPGTLPANLQGIWAEKIQTPWNADWHLNINVQMNYWPAEVCGLGDCHVPFLKLIESLQVPGRRTAQAYYGRSGWVVHTITNAWGYTAPGEKASWGSFLAGTAWACEHLWTRYAYSGDLNDLKFAYPVIKGAVECYLGMLIEEPKHGWLVTAPSNSPENRYRLPDGRVASVCMGPTMDMQILRELFGNFIQASRILDVDKSLREQVETIRPRLAPNQMGPDGRLQEWLEPYEEVEPKHRHISHMYGLCPYYEITPESTPELAAAARASLERRGDGGAGWSRAWKVSLYARLNEGNRSLDLLRALMGSPLMPGNMQLDANFGGAFGVSQMILQSHPESAAPDSRPVIHLLPALPDAWPHGEIRGWRVRGGGTVDMIWQDSELVTATLRSTLGRPITVRYGAKSIDLDTVAGREYQLDTSLRVLHSRAEADTRGDFRWSAPTAGTAFTH